MMSKYSDKQQRLAQDETYGIDYTAKVEQNNTAQPIPIYKAEAIKKNEELIAIHSKEIGLAKRKRELYQRMYDTTNEKYVQQRQCFMVKIIKAEQEINHHENSIRICQRKIKNINAN